MILLMVLLSYIIVKSYKTKNQQITHFLNFKIQHYMKKLMFITLLAVGLVGNAQITKFKLSEYGLKHGLTNYFIIKLPNKSKAQIQKTALDWTLSKPLKGMAIGALNSVNQNKIGLIQFHIIRNSILTFGEKPQNLLSEYSINIHAKDQGLFVSYNYIKTNKHTDDQCLRISNSIILTGSSLEEDDVRYMFENGIIKPEYANDKKVYESVINEVGLSLAKRFKL